MLNPKISIVGTGYVGLSTAVTFAIKGYQVITSTHNNEKAATINKDVPPFHEPELQESLKKLVDNKSLKCTLNHEETYTN